VAGDSRFISYWHRGGIVPLCLNFGVCPGDGGRSYLSLGGWLIPAGGLVSPPGRLAFGFLTSEFLDEQGHYWNHIEEVLNASFHWGKR